MVLNYSQNPLVVTFILILISSSSVSVFAQNNFTSPAKVIVQNDAVLKIPNGVILTIGSGHNITIESGGGVLIKSGGVLQVNS